MEEDGPAQPSSFMNLRQVKACGHLLLGTLHLRYEANHTNEDPRKEEIVARVFMKKRLRELPETHDKNSREHVLRTLYRIIDLNYAAIFKKINQISGELAFLSKIHDEPEFETVEMQFIWSCDYLFKSGQLENDWRCDFIVPETPEFELPAIEEYSEEDQNNAMLESEVELRRQIEGFLAIQGQDNN